MRQPSEVLGEATVIAQKCFGTIFFSFPRLLLRVRSSRYREQATRRANLICSLICTLLIHRRSPRPPRPCCSRGAMAAVAAGGRGRQVEIISLLCSSLRPSANSCSRLAVRESRRFDLDGMSRVRNEPLLLHCGRGGKYRDLFVNVNVCVVGAAEHRTPRRRRRRWRRRRKSPICPHTFDIWKFFRTRLTNSSIIAHRVFAHGDGVLTFCDETFEDSLFPKAGFVTGTRKNGAPRSLFRSNRFNERNCAYNQGGQRGGGPRTRAMKQLEMIH